jgi:hypothetical protein
MDARTIEQTADRLHRLRQDEWERLGLALVALPLAVVAAELHPSLALPLLIGGIVLAALGVRAGWLRWAIVDDLALEDDAYAIAEVRAKAARAADPRVRVALVREAGRLLAESDPATKLRVNEVRPQLEAVARELERDELPLEPWAAAACDRLLTDPVRSPLLNTALPASDARSCLVRIRARLADPRLPE